MNGTAPPPAAPVEEEEKPGLMSQFNSLVLPMLLMFGVFYFLLIRPQSKKRKEHEAWLSGLQRGDTVITQGGVIGKITAVADKVITIEVAHDVRLRVLRSHILGSENTVKNEEASKPSLKK